jgi:hypothetical protein
MGLPHKDPQQYGQDNQYRTVYDLVVELGNLPRNQKLIAEEMTYINNQLVGVGLPKLTTKHQAGIVYDKLEAMIKSANFESLATRPDISKTKYQSPHTPHKPTDPKPTSQGPKTNNSSSSSSAAVDDAYKTPKKPPKVDSKGYTPANKIKDIPPQNNQLMNSSKQYELVYGYLESINGEPEDRKLKKEDLQGINTKLHQVGLNPLPAKTNTYKKLYDQFAPFIRDKNKYADDNLGKGLAKGKGKTKGKGMKNPIAVPVAAVQQKAIKTIQSGKKKITIFGSGFIGDKGIPTDNAITTYQPFGKFIINVKQLIDDNKLRVLYAKTYQNVMTFKAITISNDYKEILLDLIDHKKFSQRLYDLLDEKERSHLNLLLTRSGVRVALKIRLNSDTDYELKKKRWTVVQGEINAGNDSQLLKDEAKSLLSYFKALKAINKTEYDAAMKDLE